MATNAMKNTKAERINPCFKEQNLSYRCLDENNYDGTKCDDYFTNYKTCKAFWNRIKSDRRMKGLHPILPEPEDRDKIREDFIKLHAKR